MLEIEEIRFGPYKASDAFYERLYGAAFAIPNMEKEGKRPSIDAHDDGLGTSMRKDLVNESADILAGSNLIDAAEMTARFKIIKKFISILLKIRNSP